MVTASSHPGGVQLRRRSEPLCRTDCGRRPRSPGAVCPGLHRAAVSECGAPESTGTEIDHAGAGRCAGRRFRMRLVRQRVDRRTWQQDGFPGNPFQPVPGHGRAEPAGAPRGLPESRADDPERPAVSSPRSCMPWGWWMCWPNREKASRRYTTTSGVKPAQGTARWRCAACATKFQPIAYAELMRVADIWVDAALRLEAKDLRMMERLVSRQTGKAETRKRQRISCAQRVVCWPGRQPVRSGRGPAQPALPPVCRAPGWLRVRTA